MPDGINTIEDPWKRLIHRCLEVDPEKRIASTTECMRILDGRENEPIMDIFVAGELDNKPVIWKNGLVYNQKFQDDGKPSKASSICITIQSPMRKDADVELDNQNTFCKSPCPAILSLPKNSPCS